LVKIEPGREGPTKIEAVFKPARYDGGLTTVSMQVGVYRLSLLSNIDGQPSAVI
jgi:hypothetical protein